MLSSTILFIDIGAISATVVAQNCVIMHSTVWMPQMELTGEHGNTCELPPAPEMRANDACMTYMAGDRGNLECTFAISYKKVK